LLRNASSLIDVIPVIAREPPSETAPELQELEKFEAGAAADDARQIPGPHGEVWINGRDQREPASPLAVEFALAHPAIRTRVRGDAIDLRAGTCWLTARLSTLFDIDTVVALDRRERFLTEVGSRVIQKRRGRQDKVRFAIGSCNRIPFPGGSFDCAFLVAAMHSLDPVETLVDARRVLRGDGTLILVERPSSVFGVRANRRRARGMRRVSAPTESCYTAAELHSMLRDAGFERVSFYPVDVLTRGVMRRGLRGLLRTIWLENVIKPPVYVIVAR
jgi:SAM-dependent methyltransferase